MSGTTEEKVPAPRRATARIAFVRALASLTDAIRELQSWRLPESAANSEGDRDLFALRDHPFLEWVVRPSPFSLFYFAGDERVQAAKDWGRRWKLDATWLQTWAVFALVVWEVVRHCKASDCPFGCNVARAHEAVALELALSQEAMLTFGEEPLLFSMLAAIAAEKDARDDPASSQSRVERTDKFSKWLPIHKRPVVGALPGPHPLLETKDQFLTRAGRAWDEAIAALTAQGLSLSEPRKLALHCEWLVRYHVRGETAAEIVKDLEWTDPSTVYKAVRSLAQVIDVSIRET